jgi:hypothetical protein
MNNIREYNKENFKEYFVTTDLYRCLANDFTHISWDDHCDIYSMITPRQFLGDKSKNVFSVTPFYYLEYLTETNPNHIYDIGCGWNIFRKYLPCVIGIGEEDPSSDYYYGQEHGRMDADFVANHQDFFESAFSINSIHFIPLVEMRQRVLDFISMIRPKGRGFVTLNTQRMVDRSTLDFLNKEFGSSRPDAKDLDFYVRKQLDNLPCNVIVFDVDVAECLNDVMEGNIRVVFER